jgi:protein tyrosine/serine phosphatase
MEMTSTGKAFAERLAGPENFARISPSLYRGADTESQGDLDELKKHGIRTIVNLRWWGWEEDDLKNAGFSTVSIPIQADFRGSDPPTEDQLRYFFYVIDDPRLAPVYFHCMFGKDRTGTMASIYRIERDGWTPAEAVEEMQHFGFRDNWVDLMKFVMGYKPRGFGRV